MDEKQGIDLLRTLIRTSLNERADQDVNMKRSVTMIRTIVSNAQQFVDTVVAGDNDKEIINKLTTSVDELKKFIMVLERNRAPYKQQVNAVLSAAEGLTKKSNFWSRPKFLNVPQHVESVKGLFNALRQAARAAYARLLPSTT